MRQYHMDFTATCRDCGSVYLVIIRNELYCHDCKRRRHNAAVRRWRQCGISTRTQREHRYYAHNELADQAEFVVIEDPNGLFTGGLFSGIDIQGMVADGYFGGALLRRIADGAMLTAAEAV